MYYLWDLYKSVCTEHNTAQDLIFAWKKTVTPREDNRFDELNVTGRDTYVAVETTSKLVYIKNFGYIHETCRKHYTRRYLVTDEYGRHIDIRNFPKWMWDVEKPVKHWYPSWTPGAKRRGPHRVNGPAMYKASLRFDHSNPLEEANNLYPELLNTAVKITVKRRDKSVIDRIALEDRYEHRAEHGYVSSKCWKDQTKTRRQYQRHNPTHQKIENKYKNDIMTELIEYIVL